MSLLFYTASQIIKFLSKSSVQEFEAALFSPEATQKKLLDGWKKNQTHLEPIENYEFTSGSSGTKKKIGYTKSLKHSFSYMFQIWASDILTHAPVKFKTGVVYMSISQRIDAHGGQEDDSEYLSPLLRPLIKKFLAVDPALQRVKTGEEFLLKLSAQLLKRRDLEIISIWSPSYFLSIMHYIESNKEAVGFRGSFKDHWPNLIMVSVWSSGESETSFKLLRERFPDVWFQGKGLLATEGPMTIPWVSAKGCLPLLNQTYFEFIDSAGNTKLLHQLSIGEEYEILPQFSNMNAPASIGDRVICTGFYHQTPLLDFVGRKGDTSDLAGEKLSGNIVRQILSGSLVDFVVIAHEKTLECNAHYIFVVDQDLIKRKFSSEEVDEQLKTIHHYKLARELQQLSPVKIFFVSKLKNKLKETQSSLGIKEGDQKDLTFIKRREIRNSLYEWARAMSSNE